MKTKSIIYSIPMAVLATMGLEVNAQQLEIISSAGTEASSATGSISYTVGELVTETAQSGEGTITQGYQQGFLTVTAIDEIIDLQLSLYPNPTSDFVILESEEMARFSGMKLYDGSGRVVWQLNDPGQNGTRIQINFQNMASGTYILSLDDKQSNRPVTYNIVKAR